MTVGRIARETGGRLLAGLAVLYGAATLAFVALQVMPGDPVATMLGPSSTASAAVRHQITVEYGFDKPVLVRYGDYLGRLARGDLGRSYQLQRPVADLIASQLWPTVQLGAAGLVLALLIAVLSATATAGRRPWLRAAANAGELVAVSVPWYWLGILLLTAFSFQMHAFPVAGAEGPSSLVLPAVTLALPISGTLSQVLREGLEAALTQPFVLTARSRGLSQSAVRWRHALRHAAVPLVTLTGWLAGTLIGNAVLVETVFGRPGVGSLVLRAMTDKDMPLVIGVVLLAALVFVLLSTIVDLLYLRIDPRLRTG